MVLPKPLFYCLLAGMFALSAACTYMGWKYDSAMSMISKVVDRQNEQGAAIDFNSCTMDSIKRGHTWLLVTPCKRHPYKD